MLCWRAPKRWPLAEAPPARVPEDPHYYIAGYSAADDPYCQPNGVLVNLLGLSDTADLSEIEAELSALEIDELLRQAQPDAFSVAHLQHLHHQIFRHVCRWAGQASAKPGCV